MFTGPDHTLPHSCKDNYTIILTVEDKQIQNHQKENNAVSIPSKSLQGSTNNKAYSNKINSLTSLNMDTGIHVCTSEMFNVHIVINKLKTARLQCC
jgi:hypothetical protein